MLRSNINQDELQALEKAYIDNPNLFKILETVLSKCITQSEETMHKVAISALFTETSKALAGSHFGKNEAYKDMLMLVQTIQKGKSINKKVTK